MPPPQQLLSSAVSIVPKKKWLNPTFLVLLVFLVVALPLSSPSNTSSSVKSRKWAHWSVTSEEICPSAKGWVTHPGSFCETLWNSPYLSNRTELEARERRAIQFYCEMDSILERFDCAQEYSVNVRRGQCQLCREAYREWACAMITDTLEDGQLDCETKLMPCPSCASICHQVMRLCPYLSPDRNQWDRRGQITPQTSQYGGHPAFYCPLENDDPSDPAYTSLCFHQSPFSTPDPDYIHNICTNPPIHLHQDPPDLVHNNHPLRYNNKPKDSSSSSYYFYSRGTMKGGGSSRTGRAASSNNKQAARSSGDNHNHFYSSSSSSSSRRSSSSSSPASSVNYFNDRAEYNSEETFNSYSVGGDTNNGGDGTFTHDSSGSSDAYNDEEEEEDDDWVSAMPHYTSCCWTYASSVVNFHPKQDFPEYGSDTYFRDAITGATKMSSNVPPSSSPSSAHSSSSSRSSKDSSLRNNKDSYVNNGSVVDNDDGGRRSGIRGSNNKGSSTIPTSTTTASSPTKPSSVSDNRVILNCCDSRGACNSRDPFDVSQEEEEEANEVSTTTQESFVKEVVNKKTRRSHEEEQVILSPALKDNQKQKNPTVQKRNGGGVVEDMTSTSSFYFPGEDQSSSSSSSRSGGVGMIGGVQALDLKGEGIRVIGGVEFLRSSREEDEEARGRDGVVVVTERPGGTSSSAGVDYDEHYVDTEPDGDGGSSSTELEDDEIFEPQGYNSVSVVGSSSRRRTSESEWTRSRTSGKHNNVNNNENNLQLNSKSQGSSSSGKINYLSRDEGSSLSSSSFSDSSPFFSSSASSGASSLVSSSSSGLGEGGNKGSGVGIFTGARRSSGNLVESESKRSFVEIVMREDESRGDVDRDHGDQARVRTSESSNSDDNDDLLRTAPDLHFVSFDNDEILLGDDETPAINKKGMTRKTTSAGGGGDGGESSGGGLLVDVEGRVIRRPATWIGDPWPAGLGGSSSSSSSSSASCSILLKKGSESDETLPRTRCYYLARVLLYRISTDCCHLFVMLLIALLCLMLTNFLPVFLLNLDDGLDVRRESGEGDDKLLNLGNEVPTDKSTFKTFTELPERTSVKDTEDKSYCSINTCSSSTFITTITSSNINRTSCCNEHFERVKKAVVFEEKADEFSATTTTCKMSDDENDSSRKYYDDIRCRKEAVDVWGCPTSSSSISSSSSRRQYRHRRINRKNIHEDEEESAFFVSWKESRSSRSLRQIIFSNRTGTSNMRTKSSDYYCYYKTMPSCNYEYVRISRKSGGGGVLFLMFMNAILTKLMSYVLLNPSTSRRSRGEGDMILRTLTIRLDLTKRKLSNYYYYCYYSYCYYYYYYYYIYLLSLRNYENDDRGDSSSKLLADLYCYNKIFKLLKVLLIDREKKKKKELMLIINIIRNGRKRNSVDLLKNMWGISQHNYCYYQAVITIKCYNYCMTSSSVLIINCSDCYNIIHLRFPFISIWFSNNSSCITPSIIIIITTSTTFRSRDEQDIITIQDLNNKGMSPLLLSRLIGGGIITSNFNNTTTNTFNFMEKAGGESCKPFVFDVCPEKIFCTISLITKPILITTSNLPVIQSNSGRQKTTYNDEDNDCVSSQSFLSLLCPSRKKIISYWKRKLLLRVMIYRKNGQLENYLNNTFNFFPLKVVASSHHPVQVATIINITDNTFCLNIIKQKSPEEIGLDFLLLPFLRREKQVSIESKRCDDFCIVSEKVCSCCIEENEGDDENELLTCGNFNFPYYVKPWKLQHVFWRESVQHILVCKSKQSEHFHGQSIYGHDETENDDEDDDTLENGLDYVTKTISIFRKVITINSTTITTIPYYSSKNCSRFQGKEVKEWWRCRLSNPLLLSIDNNYYSVKIKYYLKSCRWFIVCSIKGHEEGCWVGIVFVNVILFYDARCSLPGSGSLTRISQLTVSETSTTKSSCNNYDNLLSVNDKPINIGFLLMNLPFCHHCFKLFELGQGSYYYYYYSSSSFPKVVCYKIMIFHLYLYYTYTSYVLLPLLISSNNIISTYFHKLST